MGVQGLGWSRLPPPDVELRLESTTSGRARQHKRNFLCRLFGRMQCCCILARIDIKPPGEFVALLPGPCAIVLLLISLFLCSLHCSFSTLFFFCSFFACLFVVLKPICMGVCSLVASQCSLLVSMFALVADAVLSIQ